jgi:hypothetical protein
MEHGLAEGPALLMALEGSALGFALRQSLWLYPTVETLHILGFALLVGAIVAFDLRVLTAPAALDIAPWMQSVVPVAACGLGLAVAMGLLLFVTEATAYVRNPLFLAKMGLLAFGLGNVLWFHIGPWRLQRAIGPSLGILPAMRASALLSLLLWVGVLTCGRLIAYV